MVKDDLKKSIRQDIFKWLFFTFVCTQQIEAKKMFKVRFEFECANFMNRKHL